MSRVVAVILAVCWIVVLGYALGLFLLAAYPIHPIPPPQVPYP